MGSHSARDPRDTSLSDEDDWFSSPVEEQSDAGEIIWQDDPAPRPERPASDGLGQRQAIVVLASLAAVVLIAGGILLVRSIGGSDGATSTPTTTTPATTPAATTPAATTPAATTPATTTPSTTPSTVSVPTDATLRAGDSGTSVLALQQALTRLGFSPGAADGKFGPATTQAVTAFQKAKGLTADGAAGANTIAAINAALASG